MACSALAGSDSVDSENSSGKCLCRRGQDKPSQRDICFVGYFIVGARSDKPDPEAAA